MVSLVSGGPDGLPCIRLALWFLVSQAGLVVSSVSGWPDGFPCLRLA